MLELVKTWTSTGGSGGLDPVSLQFGAKHSALWVHGSTRATTHSFAFQTAISSGGPWVSELSTVTDGDANSSGISVLRLTGPYEHMRPYFPTKSTGAYTVHLIVTGD